MVEIINTFWSEHSTAAAIISGLVILACVAIVGNFE